MYAYSNPWIVILSVLPIAYFIFWLFDRYFLTVETTQASVEKKGHADEHTFSTTTYYNYGNYILPYNRTGIVPESFSVTFHVSEKPAIASIPKEQFDSLNIGDRITVDYSRTRFTRKIQVLKLEKKQ